MQDESIVKFKDKKSNQAIKDSVLRDNVTTAMNSTIETRRTNGRNMAFNLAADSLDRSSKFAIGNTSRSSKISPRVPNNPKGFSFQENNQKNLPFLNLNIASPIMTK